ncbi:MAG TPA: hypothetical protein PK794_09965, partial [Armatimonadota bacterium]|nr:hypothetical protein [Armatimonadota bacterium]
MVIEGNTATLTCAGTPGTRSFSLPGAWTRKDPQAPLKQVDGAWVLDYPGGAAMTVVLERR